jgi:hypothetical protein
MKKNAASSVACWLVAGTEGQNPRRKLMSKASGGNADQFFVAQIRRWAVWMYSPVSGIR